MPHSTDAAYSSIQVTPLAPTFGAEISGVDFTESVPSNVFAEIRKAITQVCTT